MIVNQSAPKPHFPILLLMMGYMLVALYFIVFLHYNFLRSDVLDYWKDSLAWQTPYHPFHVPVYALTIALLRGVTFGAFPPVAIMMGINLAALLASAFFVYRIIQAGGAKPEFAALGTLLFGLWPFVGLTYAVNPQADLPAMALFLAGLYFLQRSRRLSAAIFLGLAVVTHKAMWPFIGLLVTADFLVRKSYFSKQNVIFMAIMLFPVGALWLAGSLHHHSYGWLLSSNLKEELASTTNLPVLDGLLGAFLFEDGLKGVVKGSLLLSFALLAIVSNYLSVKFKYPDYFYGIAVSVASLLLFIVLNHYEIWAAARFSRLLVIPLVLSVANIEQIKGMRQSLSLIVTVLLLLFLSQFAYAWYMAKVFFA
jgi:hypothetical protein